MIEELKEGIKKWEKHKTQFLKDRFEKKDQIRHLKMILIGKINR